MEKSIMDLMAGIKEIWELPDVDVRTYSPLVLAYIETMHHDKLAGKRDPLAPSGVCSIEDPFGGYTPGINACKGCE